MTRFEGALDCQVAVLVRTRVEPSVYVPVAASGRVMPRAILDLIELMAIETSVAGETVKLTGADVMPRIDAVMLLVPAAAALARPLEPAALPIDATEAAAESQLTCVVNFWSECRCICRWQ